MTSIATLSGSAGLAVTSSCPTPANADVCLSDSAMETRIGVGVGTPLLVGLIGALSLFFRERRLRKNPIAKTSNGKHSCDALRERV